MSIERRFLVPSSVARLIRRERGMGTRIVEAYFPPRSDRTQFVHVEREQSFLVLKTPGEDGQTKDERIEVPASHAEALVDVAAGTVAFDRTEFELGLSIDAALDRFILPNGLDLLTLTLNSDPRMFAPPLWLGPEVTGDAAFEPQALAIQGAPSTEAVEVSNAGLEALLDWVEGRTFIGLRWPAAKTSTPAP